MYFITYRLTQPESGKAEHIHAAIMEKCEKMNINVKASCAAVAADGAAVNFGSKSGVLTRMKEDDMDYLLTIHCVAHRLELALGDAFKNTYFKNVVRGRGNIF